ncbi:MAG: hypothetical protein AB7O37_09810 [Vicinamibacteria bacterium]
MSKRFPWLLLCLLVAAAGPAAAQEKLAYLIPNLFGPGGLTVDSEARLATGETHSGHFNSSFQASFTPFNTALASQLASVPLPSPTSGFTYSFDSELGVFTRSTRSFGPLLAERAETLGKNRATLALSYQQFGFDSLDGLDLSGIPTVFTHDNPIAGTGRDDVITTQSSISAQLRQLTAFLSLGLSEHVDLSVAIPLVTVDLAVSSRATLRRIGTRDPAIHFFFRPTGDNYGDQTTFQKAGHATGIGDVALRLKGSVWRGRSLHGALGLETRLPTGDEKDLLGSGALTLKPFLVLSAPRGVVSPHLNAAYQWTGSSLLGGNILSGEEQDLPDLALLTAGVDVAASSKITVAADVVARRVIDGERVVSDTFTALDGRSRFPSVRFETASYTIVDGSLGFKANPGGGLLIDLNVVFKLNDSGLRDRVTPLFAVEYSF